MSWKVIGRNDDEAKKTCLSLQSIEQTTTKQYKQLLAGMMMKETVNADESGDLL